MARRRRLSPAQPEYLGIAAGAAPETKSTFPPGFTAGSSRAPISHVAGDAAAAAALREVTDELRSVREGGRLVLALPLEAIDAGYLVRDRLAADEDALSVLVESLRARGQQTPIEAVDLGEGRYGLISGWRRLTALKRLLAETGAPRFATVQALLRRPESAGDAYLAMVEENEVRVGLSYYERARIVARAAELKVFPDEAAALRHLFASASRARRSKIGAFLPIYHMLDSRLAFPAAIPERLGLALAKALGADPGFGPRLADRLRKAGAGSPEAELALLTRAVSGGARAAADPPDTPAPPPAAQPAPQSAGPAPAVVLERIPDGCRLTGPGVDAGFLARLQTWLAADAGG